EVFGCPGQGQPTLVRLVFGHWAYSGRRRATHSRSEQHPRGRAGQSPADASREPPGRKPRVYGEKGSSGPAIGNSLGNGWVMGSKIMGRPRRDRGVFEGSRCFCGGNCKTVTRRFESGPRLSPF